MCVMMVLSDPPTPPRTPRPPSWRPGGPCGAAAATTPTAPTGGLQILVGREPGTLKKVGAMVTEALYAVGARPL